MSYLTFQGIKPTLQPAKDEGYPGYLTPPLGMSTPAGPGFGAGSQSSAGSIPEPEPQLEEAPVKPPQPVKRTRVLLSCAPCRVSKLKCDREQPCSQCLKKGRVDICTYAPKPQKPVPPPRSMTARLKRLEALVRNMMDAGGDGDGVGNENSPAVRESLPQQQSALSDAEPAAREDAQAQVVFGQSTTYIGATHFMAMLDDIEDLKSYFDDDGENVDDIPPDQSPEPHEAAILLACNSGPMSKRHILQSLPPRLIADRLVQHYFGASSPTQSIIHRPTFMAQYERFWEDPDHIPMEWLALLLMVLALGVFFSIYAASHKVQSPDGHPPIELYRRYRSIAGRALVAAKYTSPCQTKMSAFILYMAAEFMTNRASSANCYVLSSVAIRLMLQMGLHRDPSKLPNISPFDGEMRRRMWHLAIQIELLVSFHMGLPSMVNGLESDVAPQSNLTDEDIYPTMTELPPSRPDSEPTAMTYARWKSAICVQFGKIAAQSNSVTVPAYSEVMRLDRALEETWAKTPSFMKIKLLHESLSGPPAQIHQRFGLASLYQKSRCVLHRRYLTEPVLKSEHAYSRRACLEAAMAVLQYQDIIHLATLPGRILRKHAWFLAAIATYDFLIGATIIFVLHQSETYEDDEAYQKLTGPDGNSIPQPTKSDLFAMLRRSHQIWSAVVQDAPAAKKAVDLLETMLKRIDCATGMGASLMQGVNSLAQQDVMLPEWQRNVGVASSESADPFSGLSIHGDAWQPAPSSGASIQRGFPLADDLLASELVVHNTNVPPWLDFGTRGSDVDWTSFDTALGADNHANLDLTLPGVWAQQGVTIDDVGLMNMGFPDMFNT